MPSTSGLTAGRLAGRLADKIRLDFETFKILYRLVYLNFTLSISLQCLIVLEVHFSLLFSNKAYLGCVLWCLKFGHHFFRSIPTISNDIQPL